MRSTLTGCRVAIIVSLLSLFVDTRMAGAERPLMDVSSTAAPAGREPLPSTERHVIEELPVPRVADTDRPVGAGSVRLPRLPPAEDLPFTDSHGFVQSPSSMTNELPAPSRMPAPGSTELLAPPSPLLSLGDVLRSIEQDYPLLAAVFQERGIAAGELLAAEGPFNTKLIGEGKSVPLGFYQYTIGDMYLEKANWNGGKTFAGYRIGTGPTFPIWFGELETNTGGEFRAGFTQSLLQGLAIDKRRADFTKAQIARATAEPVIQGQRIAFLQAGAVSYWEWVGAGRKYVIAQQVLKEAMERDKILAERARVGDAAMIERTDNQRIVVDRQAKLIAAGRKFQEAAIKISLFYRDTVGLPLLPDPQQLPRAFPIPSTPDPTLLGRDVQVAFQWRPELRELTLKRQSISVDLNLARNQTLPQLDGYMKAAKDLGTETPPIDKTPFQLESGVVGSIPLERSAARGSTRAAQASLAQVNARARWYEDKITSEVQDAVSALVAAHGQLRPRRDAVQLTYQMEVAERRKYEVGDSSLFVLNLRELDTRDAASLEVDAIVAYFVATAEYQAALGLDGLRITEFRMNLN